MMNNRNISSKNKIKKHSFTFLEEFFNSSTHGAASILCVYGFSLLLKKAENFHKKLCVAVFAISMMVLYLISAVYHALPPGMAAKKIFRKIDHCCVALLIFGTYFPFAILGLGDFWGWTLLGIAILSSILSIILTIINIDKYDRGKVIIYLFTGWISLTRIYTLKSNLGRSGFLWMLFGGIFYTVGSVFYAIGKQKLYFHSIFHIFCIAGTACHFWCIYNYLL